jgi:hypothetical protein
MNYKKSTKFTKKIYSISTIAVIMNFATILFCRKVEKPSEKRPKKEG